MNGKRNVNHEKYTMYIGTLDKKNPQSFYVEGTAYIRPRFTASNYKGDIAEIHRTFRNAIRNVIRKSNRLDSKFLTHIDVAEERLSNKRDTFLIFQCHFKQSEPITYQRFQDIPTEFALELSNALTDSFSDYDYDVNKTKSRK